MRTFKEFLAQRESTAAKRNKMASLLGLAAPIAEPNIHAGATAPPGYLDYYEKHVKCKKKKHKKKKKLEEKTIPPVQHDMDRWLGAVDKLKRDIDNMHDDEEKPDYISPEELDDEDAFGDDEKGFDDEAEDSEEGEDTEAEESEDEDDDPNHPLNQDLDTYLSGKHPTSQQKSTSILDKPDFKEWIKSKF